MGGEWLKAAVFKGWIDPYLWGVANRCVCHGEVFCPLSDRPLED